MALTIETGADTPFLDRKLTPTQVLTVIPSLPPAVSSVVSVVETSDVL